MKIVTLSEQEFDNYSSSHLYTSYYQTSSYGTLMNDHGLKPIYLGFYEGSSLVGASLILYKPSFVGFKYGYAPRGLLIDYSNYNQVIDIIKELKNYLFKERFILLKIDPYILVQKKDRNGNILEKNSHLEPIIESLQSAGLYHCGFNRGMESVKPRIHAYLDLTQKEEEHFRHFTKQVRNKIRKAIKLGVEIYKDNESIEQVYPFIAEKGNYSLKYYQDFKKCFSDKLEVYIAKLNTEKYVEGSRLLYEKEQEYNEYLNNIISRDGYKGKDMKDILSRKMESDKLLVIYKEYLVDSIALLRNHPEGIVIAGAVLLKDNDVLRLIIDGYDKKYGKFSSSYLLKWEIIKNYCNSEFKYLDMNAIVDIPEKEKNPYKGLTEMKLGFHTIAYEYIGEFNLIVNNPIYALYKSLIMDDSLKNIKK